MMTYGLSTYRGPASELITLHELPHLYLQKLYTIGIIILICRPLQMWLQLTIKTSEERGWGSGLLSQWMFLPTGKAAANIKTWHWNLGLQLGGKLGQWSQGIWEMTLMVSEETFSQSSMVASCLLEQWAMLMIRRGTREGSQELETSSYEEKKKKKHKRNWGYITQRLPS